MIILCDSREQDSLAYEFNHVAIDWVQICALPYADYWCVLGDGTIVPFVFERKAKGDFFGSFGGRHESEKAKLMKSRNDNVGYKIIIEGSLEDILDGFSRSTVEGITLVRTMFTWCERYGVETIFCNNRYEMVQYITERFFAYGKEYARQNKSRVKV